MPQYACSFSRVSISVGQILRGTFSFGARSDRQALEHGRSLLSPDWPE